MTQVEPALAAQAFDSMKDANLNGKSTAETYMLGYQAGWQRAIDHAIGLLKEELGF